MSEASGFLRYVDARVRKDRASPGFQGRVAIGVRGSRGPTWWVADFTDTAITSFTTDKPQTYTVAVGLDDNGARALLGLPVQGDKLQMVAGDRTFLKRFIDRYLRDVSPMKSRIAMMSQGKKR